MKHGVRRSHDTGGGAKKGGSVKTRLFALVNIRQGKMRAHRQQRGYSSLRRLITTVTSAFLPNSSIVT